MEKKFAIAPCSWGIEDPGNPDNPPWGRVLKEAGMAGSTGIELGPYGYLPTDPFVLKQKVDQAGLAVIAGTIYDDLTGEGDLAYLKDKTRKICSLLSHIREGEDETYLVILDAVKETRNHTAGQSDKAVRLKPADWQKMMTNIKEISHIASKEYGIRPVVHPHAGGYLEFKDETEQFLNDVPGDLAGLCLDTGHVYYAGEDPAEELLQFQSRLDYIHFKDINPGVYRKAVEQSMGFFDACKIGVMCSIGKGCVDYNQVFAAIDKIGYSGWITIEQERDPNDTSGTLKDLQESLGYLKSL